MATTLQHLDDLFQFGKFKGCTLGEVLMFNPDYLVWVVDNISGRTFRLEDSAVEEINMIFPDFPITDEFEEMRMKQLYESYDVNEYEEDKRYDKYEQTEYDWYDPPSYERYSGSFAQDEMGYSDDDIDTIFDGDPLAYWNID